MSGKQVPFTPAPDAPVIVQMNEQHLAAIFKIIEDTVRKVVKEEMRLETEQPMDVADVAKFLDLNADTIRLKTRQGLIPSRELEPGGQKFYFASEIVAKLKEQK